MSVLVFLASVAELSATNVWVVQPTRQMWQRPLIFIVALKHPGQTFILSRFVRQMGENCWLGVKVGWMNNRKILLF